MGVRILILMTLAITTGAVVSIAAIVFAEWLDRLNDLLLISPWSRIQHDSSRVPLWLITLLVPTAGGLLVGLLLRYGSTEGRPLGPADAILAAQTRQPLPPLRAGLVSTVAAALALGSGASVGQYGPMVYLGAMVGGLANRLGLKVQDLQSIAIASGVAAAISTAFNAPIAGLVFAHEVILRHYALQAFAPTTVAAATGYVVANVVFHRPALFLVGFGGVSHGHEFLLFAIIGVLAALLAIAYMRLTLWIASFARRSRLPAAVRPAIAGLAVGLVAIWLPDVLGIGKETLRFATIEGAFEPGEIVLILIAKLVLTALCIGFGFAGGVFSPALLMGILFGAAFWMALDGLTGIPNSGLIPYAISGMMAVTSSVIGAPLTTILIVFELTRSYDLTIAAMVSVVLANLVSQRLFGRSLFDVQLEQRGIDLAEGRDRARLSTLPIASFVDRGFPRANSDEPLERVLDRLRAAGRAEVVVVDGDGRYLGRVRASEVVDQPGATPVGELASRAPIVFDERTTLFEAMGVMEHFIGDAVPVVESDSGAMLGTLSERAVVAAYLEALQDLRREENQAA